MINKRTMQQFIERGADLEHERWAGWQKYLHSKCEYCECGRHYYIPNALYERWERQINTPYSELPEGEKESDRKEVRKYLPLIEVLMAEVLESIIAKIEQLRDEVNGEGTYKYDWCMNEIIEIIVGMKQEEVEALDE